MFGMSKDLTCNMDVDEKTAKHISENNRNNIDKRSKI